MTDKVDKWVMLAIGLAGGWVISTAPGWMHASSYEHWWSIATAVGTVGAVIAAVVIASQTEMRLLKEKRQQATSLKWATCRWAGSVKTGSYLLSKHFDMLAKTEIGKPFSRDDKYMIELARKMIDPSFMLPLMGKFHVLEEADGRTSNAVSYAWALCAHIDNILTTAKVAHEGMEILSTCAKQSKELHDLAENIISAY
ncbi:hypothetical protein [Castellaniella sp.]|uniref:hypothetical protein n=1 Tax=Castellaniella sp. TaxID=1955812 RepID=UPI003C71AD07